MSFGSIHLQLDRVLSEKQHLNLRKMDSAQVSARGREEADCCACSLYPHVKIVSRR